MSFLNQNPHLINKVVKLAKDAGESILDIYNNPNSDFKLKEDKSPLTVADIASHKIIVKGLKDLKPELPIISEEGSEIPFKVRSKWNRYWLVDPLDGTKEFLQKNGEFTVNISLIDNNRPILGVINIPVNDETYWGSESEGSFFQEGALKIKKIHVKNKYQGPIRIASSRSHPSILLNLFLKKIKDYELVTKGSSIKFCLIASGQADIYPRLGPTSEWDTAAGQAILVNAGGSVIQMNGSPLRYNKKKSLLNQNFIAISTDQSKEIKKYLDSFA